MSISVARDVTEHAKPPRAVFVPFRMGHHFGTPFHEELQRRIILEALDLLGRAQDSPTIVDLDVTWAQARREGKAIEERASREGSVDEAQAMRGEATEAQEPHDPESDGG